MTGQDFIQDDGDGDEDDYDDSFVPNGGFPVEPVARMADPASGFAISGRRNFPPEFAEESMPVNKSIDEDPCAHESITEDQTRATVSPVVCMPHASSLR